MITPSRRWGRLLTAGLVAVLLLTFLNTSHIPSKTHPRQFKSDSQIIPLTAIVVATSQDDFPSSLEQLGLYPSQDAMVIYRADDPTAPLHPPMNKGREAISYLTYLIDNYDSLPALMVFIHAHNRTWHQNTLLAKDTQQTLRRLRRQYVLEKGYANLLCEWRSSCPFYLPTTPKNPGVMNFSAVWSEMMTPGITAPPPFIASPTGAQFAVTASTVRAHLTREQLQRMRDWIIDTRLSSVVAGSIFEYLWVYLFLGADAESCPQETVCYCRMFGVCFDEGDGSSEVARGALRAYYDLLDYRGGLVARLLDAEERVGNGLSLDNVDVMGVRRELGDIEAQLQSVLDRAVNWGLAMYPPDGLLSIDKIDILGGLMKY